MKDVYGYIRVSDIKQLEGVSLQEQKRLIKEFALKKELNIIEFYEENKTAAKTGRPLFDQMIQNLKDGKATGVIMHKIDRSARNLHDWATVGDLIDNGIQVYFAHESLDLTQRGGRLSADIQAVMASDYVRNLRQETLKGLYGRLKQGIFPFAAPIGYLNHGKGKLKTPDPEKAHLVVKAFELYASEKYSVRTLSEEMEKRGLTNRRGSRVCKNSITKILRNPFYIGQMKVKGTTYKGNHERIIDTRTFDQVQFQLNGRVTNKGIKHRYLFRKQLRCGDCKLIMPGERQKGTVYYRCQQKACATKTIREDHVERYVKNMLQVISLDKKEINRLTVMLKERTGTWKEDSKQIIEGYTMQQKRLELQEHKLLDAFLENLIDKEEYQKRKEKLLRETQELTELKIKVKDGKGEIFSKMGYFLELCKSPLDFYNSGIIEEKRNLLKTVSSNLTIQGRKAVFTMAPAFSELVNRDFLNLCALERDTNRTLVAHLTYTDKNTSGITPSPMNKEQLSKFLDTILAILPRINIPKNHEL